jgi:hypothetical protein
MDLVGDALSDDVLFVALRYCVDEAGVYFVCHQWLTVLSAVLEPADEPRVGQPSLYERLVCSALRLTLLQFLPQQLRLQSQPSLYERFISGVLELILLQPSFPPQLPSQPLSIDWSYYAFVLRVYGSRTFIDDPPEWMKTPAARGVITPCEDLPMDLPGSLDLCRLHDALSLSLPCRIEVGPTPISLDLRVPVADLRWKLCGPVQPPDFDSVVDGWTPPPELGELGGLPAADPQSLMAALNIRWADFQLRPGPKPGRGAPLDSVGLVIGDGVDTEIFCDASQMGTHYGGKMLGFGNEEREWDPALASNRPTLALELEIAGSLAQRDRVNALRRDLDRSRVSIETASDSFGALDIHEILKLCMYSNYLDDEPDGESEDEAC